MEELVTRRRTAIIGLLLAIVAALLLWWAYPTAEVPVEDDRRTVHVPKRPAWTRRQLSRGPLFPRAAQQPVEEAEFEEPQDTGVDSPDSLATLEGFVVDEEGRPMPGVRVVFQCVLLDEPGEPGFIGGVSDRDGYFEFDVTAPTWCRGRAFRRDGLLKAVSLRESAELEVGDAVEFEFQLPARAGGLGVGFDAIDGN
ncbi:MAG: hypothetical protein ACI9MC_003064, partial [Kiritimatiellia bacterium]